VDDELFDLLASTVAALGLELVDAEVRAGLVRVVVDRTGGADVDAIAEATRAVSAVLDAHDPQPGRRYTLEVSSPGVERPLRSLRHFTRAVGEIVTLRTVTGSQGERRVTGRLAVADEDGFVLEGEGLADGGRRFAYEEVERARTVFEWPAAARPSETRRGATGWHRTAASDRKKGTEKVTTR
jgi:ribosome maturation factor RimP